MIGILLMNFGGPPSNDPALIGQYIYNIIADPVNWPWRWGHHLQPTVARAIARRRVPAVVEQYGVMGGRSPLVQFTAAQARGLAKVIAPILPETKVFVGMQNWTPLIEEVIPEVAIYPLTNLVLLPLYPHVSCTTSTTCLTRARAAWRRHGASQVRLHPCDGWYLQLRYVQLCAALLHATLAQFPEPAATHILFTAHSLPQAIVDRGDIYPHQIRAQIAAIVKAAGVTNRWTLGFQSRLGPVPWLAPDVETCIAACARDGVRALCLMPLSFVADQLETLYEIDVTYVEAAHHHGIKEIRRVPVVNDHPEFIECLKELVMDCLNGTNIHH